MNWRGRERDGVDGVAGHGLAQDMGIVEGGHGLSDLGAVALARADVDRVLVREPRGPLGFHLRLMLPQGKELPCGSRGVRAAGKALEKRLPRLLIVRASATTH